MAVRKTQQDIDLEAARERWSALGDLTYEWDAKIREYLTALSIDDLARLASDARMFGETNCGWAEYHGVRHAAGEARWMLRLRTADEAEPSTAEAAK